MAHKLTIEELKALYWRIDREGKEALKDVQSEQEYTLNAMATIKMNAATQAKSNILQRIGKLVVESQESGDDS